MIMGLGGQLTFWPQSMIEALTEDGHRVIVFDNRDIGLSTQLHALGTPNMAWQWLKAKLGWPLKPPYTLQDMALDTLALMDGLRIERAHIVGISMGGMIAQRVAATAPGRVISLASIMSSSGAPGLPGPRADVARALITPPSSAREDDVVAHAVQFFQRIGSPGFAQDWDAFAELARANVRRAPDTRGAQRQLLAVVADRHRYALLDQISAPTLVLHGQSDPLVPITCGRDTAQRIANATFEAIDGMGHDLPPGVLALVVQHLQALWRRAERVSSQH
jgi:pimeloyl-ACP methyl ester carboxylesterase